VESPRVLEGAGAAGDIASTSTLTVVVWGIAPPVAVIMTVKSPAALPLHAKVLVPEDWIVVEVRLQETLAGAATASVIVPMKSFCGVTVIVTAPEAPLLKLRNETLVASVTSGAPPTTGVVTVTCTMAVWLCEPCVPVIVTV